MYCDSHAHLTCDPVFEDVSNILKRAKEKLIRLLTFAPIRLTLQRGLKLAEDVKWIYNVGATTPHDVEKEGGIYFHLFEEAATRGKLVAIGETGLDYHYEHSPKTLQQAFLIRYFELAKRCNLPVVIHCRDAFDDLFALMMSVQRSASSPVLGTLNDAEKALGRNWLISFSGIITF
ncbi:MAG: TatD family hydrolase [Chlamydiales bacterium]|nr:TatD family hydrolase [Chlamydiales bacterium]